MSLKLKFSFFLKVIIMLSHIGTIAFAFEKAGTFLLSEISNEGNLQALDQIQKASVALVFDHDLKNKKLLTLKEHQNFCSSEKGDSDRVWSYCSGVLISKDEVLTAGHCFQDKTYCSNMNFVFDYNRDSAIEEIQTDSNKIYRCSKLVIHSSDPLNTLDRDYAIVKLDREVKDRKPLPLKRLKNTNIDFEPFFAFGYPNGTSLKVSIGYFGPQAALLHKSIPFYSGSASVLTGQSGSPVFNQNLELLGILIRSGPALESDDGIRPRCNRYKDCDSNSCPWVHIQKIQNVIQDLNNLKSGVSLENN